MIIKKALSLKSIYRFTGQHLLWLVPWMLIVTSVYRFTHWKLITIPWLPLSLIGAKSGVIDHLNPEQIDHP